MDLVVDRQQPHSYCANLVVEHRRPPPQLSEPSIQAALQANMHSIGLDLIARRIDSQSPALTGVTKNAQGAALEDIPLVGLPPRYEQELTLPLPDGFTWPHFAFCALYEHSGEEREAQARVRQRPCCSIADRRCILPTSTLTWHFIGTVQDFVAAYPHPLEDTYSHITCGWSNWASWKTWEQKLRNGAMLAAAEELLWILCLGNRACAEQPPSAMQHILGPPTQKLLGRHHGAPDKTYCLWLRNLSVVPNSLELTDADCWNELAVRGDAETKMLKRGYTPRNVANACAWEHAQLPLTSSQEYNRPANVPCHEYFEWRAQMLSAYVIFRSHYAPRISTALLMESTSPLLVLIPVAQSAIGPCFMIPLDVDATSFGCLRDATIPAEQQANSAAELLDGGLKTVFAAYKPSQFCDATDAIVLVPHDKTPARVANSMLELVEMRKAGAVAAWATTNALRGHACAEAVDIAALKIQSMVTHGTHGGLHIGVWALPRPAVRFRTAREWARKADGESKRIASEWQSFLEAERLRGTELRLALKKADAGDGELIAIADSVITAFEIAGELPMPRQGFPSFDSHRLGSLPFIRPLPLTTNWLVKLPPQPRPPGFKPLKQTQILRGWARRKICKAMDKTIDRDFDLWTQGHTNKSRPEYVCLGMGAGKQIAHADGIGSYNALSLLYERDSETGLYDLLDFERPRHTHWVLKYMRQIFGDIEDQMLLSLIFDGVRWGVNPQRQIRIAANLERLDARVEKVGRAFAKLIEKGLYYKYTKLRKQGGSLDPNADAGYSVHLPTYVVGAGGTDKADSPSEARIVGDQTAPHDEVREQNSPHGASDGPIAISLNDLMGPTPGTFKRGVKLQGNYPMPDPETKTRPKHVYRNAAIMSHIASTAQTYLVSVKDDGRHFFFQFEISPEDEWTCSFLVLVPFPVLEADGSKSLDNKGVPLEEVWAVNIVATCMNMGTRNSSKIAQCFSNEWLRAFSARLDAHVAEVWLPQQNEATRKLLQTRATSLGPEQARPFDAESYTDDYEFLYAGPELAAIGTRIWRDMNRQANFWLSTKSGAGTILDFIGGRLVLNGGFGCLSPSKRARAVRNTMAALEGKLSRETLESHNSFLVHAAEWLNFPEGTLKGLWAPLKLPGSMEQMAVIDGLTASRFNNVLSLLHARDSASFWSGVDDTLEIQEDLAAGGTSTVFAPHFMSDACSDVENPFICGYAAGLYWRFPLTGEWRQRHITLTEACGSMLNLLIFPRYWPRAQYLVPTDATAALAAVLSKQASSNLIYLRQRAEEEHSFLEAIERAWGNHVKGWGNAMPDAGSRDQMERMHALARAFGVKLREIPIPEHALEFMADVLQNTNNEPLTLPAESEPQTRGAVMHGRAFSSDEDGNAVSGDPGTRTLPGTKVGATIYGYGQAISCSSGDIKFRHVDQIIYYRRVVHSPLECNSDYDEGIVVDVLRLLTMLINVQVAMDRDADMTRIRQMGFTEHDVEILRRSLVAANLNFATLLEMLEGIQDASKLYMARVLEVDPKRRAVLTHPDWFGGLRAAHDIFTQRLRQVESIFGLERWRHFAEPRELTREEKLNILMLRERPRTFNIRPTHLGWNRTDPWDRARTRPGSWPALNWPPERTAWPPRVLPIPPPQAVLPLIPPPDEDILPEPPPSPPGGRIRKRVYGRQRRVRSEPWDIVQFPNGNSNPSWWLDLNASDSEEDSEGESDEGEVEVVEEEVEPQQVNPPENTGGEGGGINRLRGGGFGVVSRSPSPIRNNVAANAGARSREKEPSPEPLRRTTSTQAAPAAPPGSPEQTFGQRARTTELPPRPPEPMLGEVDLNLKREATHRAGSPQPRTAKAALEAANSATADLLASDTSAYAICAQQPEHVKDMVQQVNEAAAAGVPHGTRNADNWGFNWAVKFGDDTGTRWMRPREATSIADQLREQYFVAMFLVWLAHNMSPSARRKKEGYGKAKPTSSMLAVYAFARILRRCGRYVPEFRFVRAVLKGVCHRYKQIWGQDSLVPSRKQPYSQKQLHVLIGLLAAQGMVGWSGTMHLVFITLVCFCLSTGTRKDEWAESFSGDTYLRRANFCWVDEHGNDLPATMEILLSRKNGCLLRGRSAPAKCDRLNVEWGAKDQWFRFDNTNPLNFAWRWYQWELAQPCNIQDRGKWPAFSPTGNNVPFKARQADTLLVSLLTVALGAAEAAVLSWHAFRVTCAMALLAERGKRIMRDEIEGVIQTVVRWKTVEALRIYARTKPGQYADYVDMCTRNDASLANANEMPEIDPYDVLEEHESTLEAIAELERSERASNHPERHREMATPTRRRVPNSPPVLAGPSDGRDREVFDLGRGNTATDLGPETWDLKGRALKIDNSFWGSRYDDGGKSDCVVAGFIGGYQFEEGYSRHTYVMTCDGHEYPIRYRAVLNGLQDASIRRRLQKQPPPRVIH